VKGGGNGAEREPVMPAMMESVWHNTASMTMCVHETTRHPHAQLN